METKDLVLKYFTDTIDLWAVKNFSKEVIFSREYFDKLNSLGEVLSKKVPSELDKAITLNDLRQKLEHGEELTFEQKTFIKDNMKLVQFLGAEDLALVVGKGFYNENGYVNY